MNKKLPWTLHTTASFYLLAKKTRLFIGAGKRRIIKMPYDSKIFGIVISRLRLQRGLTQEKMSGLAGISRSHLAALESGSKTVKLNTLWNIAYALNMQPCELVCLVEKELRRKV